MTFMGFQEPFNNYVALLGLILTVSFALEVTIEAFGTWRKKS
jgi:hypothetical protein